MLANRMIGPICAVLLLLASVWNQVAGQETAPDTATPSEGSIAEAIALNTANLKEAEEYYGPDHPATAGILYALGRLYRADGRYTDAEAMYTRSLAIYEKKPSPEHPVVAEVLNSMGSLLLHQRRSAEAERTFARALSISEKAGEYDYLLSDALNGLAEVYLQQDRLAEAEPLFRRSLNIMESELGADHPLVIKARKDVAELLRNAESRSSRETP